MFIDITLDSLLKGDNSLINYYQNLKESSGN